MSKLDLNNPVKVFFIGIGGISMSGLALILRDRGFSVSGSDRSESEMTEALTKAGVTVFLGHNKENITEDVGLVVFTPAISDENPELLRARELNIPTVNRAELLGNIMELYPESITVSGTHGKTTTSSMIASILMESKNPTVTIGGVLPAIKSNVRIGGDKYFVAEACEYKNSFHSFYPKYSVILNVEEDHPDFFKSLEDIKDSFKTFAGNTKAGGTIIINKDIPGYEEIAKVPEVSLLTFGMDESADLYPKNLQSSHGVSRFIPVFKGQEGPEVVLHVPGDHNIYNALGAICLSYALGVSSKDIVAGLAKFGGAHRRFEYLGTCNDAPVYDDYAHHPTEITACLKAARQFEPKRLLCFFQPHTYSRTKALFSDFVEALSLADTVVLAEIYAAREDNPHKISSKDLSDALKSRGVDSMYFPTMDEGGEFLKKNLMHDDMLIIMGAGDIYLSAKNIVE